MAELRRRQANGGDKSAAVAVGDAKAQHATFGLARLLDRDHDWGKDELGDVILWMRQILGIVCGLTWGAIPLVGGLWLVLYLVLNFGLAFGYYAGVLRVDEEDFGGHAALLQEGAASSIGLFMLTWILAYSCLH